MAPQELILSACSSETTAIAPGRSTSAPAIHLHDLLSASSVQPFKTSVSSAQSVSHVQTRADAGGAIYAVQEGKAIVHVWAWQKDQMHLKLHLPEKLSCFKVSPDGCWAAGGSPTGHIYLWEISSGLLHASFTAHYRTVTTLTFSADSRVLVTSSMDSSVHVYLVSRLVDPEGDVQKPYGTLNDHTLGIRDVSVSKTSSALGGRCLTASDDGTVKLWSLSAPFDLLSTFTFPPGVVPCVLALEPSERYFYVGTTGGDVYHVPLFKRRGELGGANSDIEAIGGGGQGAPPTKVEGAVISYKSPITALALSLSSSHLLVGTQSADIHIHSLPSHQHLRTISSHAGPITHLSCLLRPPDLVGSTTTKHDAWPAPEIKPLERMRMGRTARDVQEVTMTLRPTPASTLDALRGPRSNQLASSSSSVALPGDDQLAELLAENKRLRSSLDRATKINDKMWNGIVDSHLLPKQDQPNGHV
ncbi:putative ribosomal large subunit assembly and maintenance-related protein [Papiliotrema laurentii]|uniref:Pre-rRNA-processing protein IPI3 n=1 Tax=Papiliotrema laurentii TaxID=5418 RepID=A0AAD9FKB7_PAPLA|nr:putative ribosomal large subunit assembly and maintenance-related protein [Papiliotrema laurentii]